MKTQYHQGPETPPEPLDPSDSGILDAAEARAAFWQYPPQGPWTVPVQVGQRAVQVHRQPVKTPNGEPSRTVDTITR